MKQTFLLFLIAIICMANQCGDEPCENAPQCESVELGTLNLDPTSATAIPFQGNETVTFVNPQGFRATFKAQGYKTNTDRNYATQWLDNCGYCSEFYRTESSALLFQGTNLNFSFNYERLKNLPENYDHSFPDPPQAKDVLALTLGPIRFAVPLTQAPIELMVESQWRLRDSVVLGPKTYYQVYEAWVPDMSGNYGILPQGIYYTRQEGLIGYYFTNKELWYKQ